MHCSGSGLPCRRNQLLKVWRTSASYLRPLCQLTERILKIVYDHWHNCYLQTLLFTISCKVCSYKRVYDYCSKLKQTVTTVHYCVATCFARSVCLLNGLYNALLFFSVVISNGHLEMYRSDLRHIFRFGRFPIARWTLLWQPIMEPNQRNLYIPAFCTGLQKRIGYRNADRRRLNTTVIRLHMIEIWWAFAQ